MKIEKGSSAVREDNVKIKFRGLYDVNGLSDAIKSFYEENLLDFYVDKYKWKAKEGEWVYRGDRKITEYIKVFLYCDCWFWIVNTQEVEEDGQKVKKYYGRILMELNASFFYNYGGTFNPNNKIQKRMLEMLDTKGEGIQFGDLKGQGEKFMEKMLNKFTEHIKNYLGMECLT